MNRMNKHIGFWALILMLGAIISFTSCHKNESMEAIITVKLMADTSIVMPGVRVELSQVDVEIAGYTDGNGEFRYTFESPIQIDIKAFNDTLTGLGVINLSDYGIDYEKTIFIF